MCILSYLPPETDVDETGLRNGGLNNPDGHGWAIVTDDDRRIIVGKSLNLDQALEGFTAARAQNMRGPALFHSRWKTHGAINIANTHPFEVAKSPLTVMAHNGILRAAAQPGVGDPRSDTRKFADEILFKNYRRLDRPGVMNALTQYCGIGNKLVILTVDPRLQRSAYIINEAKGKWDAYTGIWHSNGDYLYFTARGYRYGGYGYGGWETEQWPTTIGKRGGTRTADEILTAKTSDDEGRCMMCDLGHVDRLGVCDNCFQCETCGEHCNDCCCWSSDAFEIAEVNRWEESVMEDADRWERSLLAQNVIDVDEARWSRAADRAAEREEARIADSVAALATKQSTFESVDQ